MIRVKKFYESEKKINKKNEETNTELKRDKPSAYLSTKLLSMHKHVKLCI